MKTLLNNAFKLSEALRKTQDRDGWRKLTAKPMVLPLYGQADYGIYVYVDEVVHPLDLSREPHPNPFRENFLAWLITGRIYMNVHV